MSSVAKPCQGPRSWTDAQRAEQALKLHERQIWLKSTGPRTPEGKAKSSMNACKPGYEDRQQKRRVQNYIRLNRLFVSIYCAQRPQWHELQVRERISILQELSVLKNELRLLGAKILDQMSDPSNIIPFPVKPPD